MRDRSGAERGEKGREKGEEEEEEEEEEERKRADGKKISEPGCSRKGREDRPQIDKT